MMLYHEYERLRAEYLTAQDIYRDVLNEKEELFQRTQPKGLRTDSEHVSGGAVRSAYDEYLIAKDELRIEERLKEAQDLMLRRKDILTSKEIELRASFHTRNKIYTLRFIDRLKIKRIARLTNYSRSQVYRIVQSLESELRGGGSDEGC